jgi:RHS repeat-associated protein
MKRLVLVALCLVVTAAGAEAQVTPFYSPTVDLEVQTGSAVLTLQRVTPPAMLKGQPLGARWTLELAGFGDPIALDGQPARTMAAASGFSDVTDARKRLTSRTDRRGNAMAIAYDGQGRVTAINGPKNALFTFTRDRTGRVVSIRTPRGDLAYGYTNDDLSTVTLNGGPPIRYAYGTTVGPSRVDDPQTGPIDVSYDASGRVSAYRFADGSTARFEFDSRLNLHRATAPDGAMTLTHLGSAPEMTDAGGHRWRIEWDAVRRTRIDTAPDGAITRTTFDAADRVTAIVDPLGRRTEYEYNTAGQLAAMVHPGDRRQTFEFDRFGSLTAERVNGQLIRSFTYNPDGTVASARGLNWPERRYSYTAAGLLSAVTMAMGGTTTFEYDARGNPIRETNPLKGVTTRTYDAQNRLLTEVEPSGAEWKFRYDDRGRLIETTDPVTGVNRLELDARGRATAATGATGRSTFEYDGNDRLTRVVRPGGRVDVFSYDPRGFLIRRTAANGTSESSEYDAAGRVVRRRVDGAGDAAFQYNAAGDLVGRADTGALSALDRDPIGQIARITSGTAASRFQHDAVGRLLSATDPLGRDRRWTYGPDGTLQSVISAGGDEIQFAHDLEGRRTSVRRASGGTERYSYDAAGNVIAQVSPLGAERRATYDGSGRPTAFTSPGGAITITRDLAGRITERDLGNGTKQTFRYDAAGRLVEASDGSNPIRYTLDAAGRTTQVDFVTAQKSVRSTFDEKGRRRALVDGDGKETAYDYNDASQVTAIRLADGSRISFSYDATGQVRTIGYPNGVVGTFERDARGDMTRVAYSSPAGQPLVSRDYVFDTTGNPVERRSDGTGVTRYTYDKGDQLIEETVGAIATRLQYGAGGNRASLIRGGVTTSYEYDADDRLIAAETVTPPAANRRGAAPARSRVTFSYDGRGAIERKTAGSAITSFTFDPLDRLTGVSNPDGATITFEYSAEGDRLTRRDASGITRFLYDGLDLIQEIDGRGQTLASYTFAPGIDRPLAMAKGGQLYFFLADRDGSILAITDRQGRVVSSYEYDAFGAMRATREGVTSPFGFTGREFDRATQLNYHRARYYDPAIGRFLSPDPALPQDSEPLTFNPYIYAINNPLKYTDAMGLAPDPRAPYPSDWREFVKVKLDELGEPAFEEVPARPSAGPRPKPVSKWPIRDGKEWIVNRNTPVGGPESYRVAPERAPKLREFFPDDAVTPRQGTPAPSFSNAVTPGRGTPVAPAIPRPFANAPSGAPYNPDATVRLSAQDLMEALEKEGVRPPPGPRPPAPGLRDDFFRTPGDFSGRPGTANAAPPPAPQAPGPPSAPPAGGVPSTPPGGGTPPPSTPPSGGTSASGAPQTVPGSSTQQIPRDVPARPGDTLRTPSQPEPPAGPTMAPLILVMTVQQLATCYRDNLSWDQCAERMKWAATFGIGGAAVMVYLERQGGRLLAAGRWIGKGSVVLAAGMVAWETIDSYNELLNAARAMDESERAIASQIETLRTEHRRVATLRGAVEKAIVDQNRIVGRFAVNIEEAGRDLAQIALQITELEKSGPACQAMAKTQLDIRSESTLVAARLAHLRTQVGGMRQLLAACSSPGDAADIRVARTQAATLVADIDAALKRAQDKRAQLLKSVFAQSPAADYAAVSAMAEDLEGMRPQLLSAQATLESSSFDQDSGALLRNYRTAYAKLAADFRTAQQQFRQQTVTEAAINLIRTPVTDLDSRFRRLSDDLVAESGLQEKLMAEREAELNSPRRVSALEMTRRLLRQVTSLESRLGRAGCSFTDDEQALDSIRSDAFDASTLGLESDRIAADARKCDATAGEPPSPTADRDANRDPQPPQPPPLPGILPRPPDPSGPPAGTTPSGTTPGTTTGGGFVPPPRVLEAVLECGGVLELPSGGRPEICGVRVRGWESSRTPVEVRILPPFTTASGLLASPGDTSMGGDVMYAAGVQDRPDEYRFSEAWRALRGAPAGSTTIVVIVRQGASIVRLPLTLNVIPPGAPTGSSLEPPTPNITGSGGPYCVWQYKLFGDPVGCWHLVAAGCTERRYAGRPEYVMVGNNLTRGEADRRIGELSRYFDDQNCKAPQQKTDDPWGDPSRQPDPLPDPPIQPQPPSPPPAPEPPPGPVSRFSRFGIAPRDSTIKVGETIALKAYATANGAPDMVLTLDEREVRWSGDKPPTFTATAADAGRAYRITATGPAGESDTVTILVDRATTTVTGPTPPPPGTGPVVNGPAPAGALGLVDKVIKPSRTDGAHSSTLGETTCETRFVEGPSNFRIASWGFGQPPPHLEAGKTYELSVSASLQQEPRIGSQSYPNTGVIHLNGFDVTKDSTPGQVTITNGQVIATPGRYRFTLRPGVSKAVIAFSCDGPMTFATYTYGAK